ncbi:MAG TPA: PEP-CTERM sorting domain-containing protein [Phycisphaerae bacterium]|nr:PEP-CTERM sorting domain-containing protein [Phycisphaerae bacterium]HNU45663.1 PEP-CTERM sorting domain-containing protein [Phycisphaerae bacterium]
MTKYLCALVSVVCLVGSTPVVEAGLFEDVAFALGALGFDYQGDYNRLSGGADFRAVAQFQGNPLDFGTGDLTLRGPLSFEVSTGHRFVDTLDISLQTALTGDNASQALAYAFNMDMCGQETQVTGDVLVDSNLSINGFGCYKLDVVYSHRQQVENVGGIDEGTATHDFDIGPISVQGNVATDLLAALLNPLFTRAGRENPLAPYTGQAQLQKAIQEAEARVQAGLAGDPVYVAVGPSLPSSSLTGTAANADSIRGAAVPEPGTLVLAAIGASILGTRRLRRRFRA